MVKNYRARPKGWRNDSVRHSLASKGIKTQNKEFDKFKEKQLNERLKRIEKEEDERIKKSFNKRLDALSKFTVPDSVWQSQFKKFLDDKKNKTNTSVFTRLNNQREKFGLKPYTKQELIDKRAELGELTIFL